MPRGISILCIFYILNSILFSATTLLFSEYLDIVISGKIISGLTLVVIRLILIILPLYLAVGLSYLRKETYFIVIIYHLFFIINSITTLFCFLNKNLKLRPLLQIILKPDYKIPRIIDLFGISFQMYAVQILSIIIGLIIIIYISKKRKLFTE